MKAFIFAAGKGERMHPLSAHCPKPLLSVGGTPLIVRHLQRLAAAGFREVVINSAWLATQLHSALGDGAPWGLRIAWSHEGDEPLETGGGLLHALPLLGPAPFLVINGDVWCDCDFADLARDPDGLAHLLLVDPPVFAPDGDFVLRADGRIGTADSDGLRLTYAGIGVYRPELFAQWRHDAAACAGIAQEPPRFPLLPLLRAAITRGQISGTHFRGLWSDIGTPQRLAEWERMLAPAATRAGAP